MERDLMRSAVMIFGLYRRQYDQQTTIESQMVITIRRTMKLCKNVPDKIEDMLNICS
jgi:hypothetical protein